MRAGQILFACSIGLITAALTLHLTACALRPAEDRARTTKALTPVLPAQPPTPMRDIVQVRHGKQVKWVICTLNECPKPTPKTLAMTLSTASLPTPSALTVEPIPSVIDTMAASGPSSEPAQQSEAPLLQAAEIDRVSEATQPASPDSAHQGYRADLATVSALPRSASVAARAEAETVVIGFRLGRTTLTPQARRELSRLRPTAARADAVVVRGRTDSLGSERTNSIIAARRAQAVHDYLVSRRIVAAALITIEARGSCCYVATNDTPRGRAGNRRAEIEFIRKSEETAESASQPASMAGASLPALIVAQPPSPDQHL